jgi:hypothetical protein
MSETTNRPKTWDSPFLLLNKIPFLIPGGINVYTTWGRYVGAFDHKLLDFWEINELMTSLAHIKDGEGWIKRQGSADAIQHNLWKYLADLGKNQYKYVIAPEESRTNPEILEGDEDTWVYDSSRNLIYWEPLPIFDDQTRSLYLPDAMELKNAITSVEVLRSIVLNIHLLT